MKGLASSKFFCRFAVEVNVLNPVFQTRNQLVGTPSESDYKGTALRSTSGGPLWYRCGAKMLPDGNVQLVQVRKTRRFNYEGTVIETWEGDPLLLASFLSDAEPIYDGFVSFTLGPCVQEDMQNEEYIPDITPPPVVDNVQFIMHPEDRDALLLHLAAWALKKSMTKP